MSELITTRRHADLRWQLLATVSALTLTAYVSSTAAAKAEDAGRPTVWIELGAQLEHLSGVDKPFAAGFYDRLDPSFTSPAEFQNALPLAIGPEGKITVEPGNSWVFSADIRYGRAGNRRDRQQKTQPGNFYNVYKYQTGPAAYNRKCCHTYTVIPNRDNFVDVQSQHQETHLILDFQAGKDVGLGLFGGSGSSVISAGVRFAQLQTKSSVSVKAATDLEHYNQFTAFPSFSFVHQAYPQKYSLGTRFRVYSVAAESARSFRGIGPSLSWDASATLAGDPDSSELTFEWGVNAALLFGKQKVKTDHQSSGGYVSRAGYVPVIYAPLYTHPLRHYTRSRNVTVPNVGGMAGFSIKWPNAKISMGYRAGVFFGAMDTGWDTRRTSTTSFYGPFATISVGLGG